MKVSRRILSFIIVLSMLSSVCVFAANDTTEESWDIALINQNLNNGLSMPFHPTDKYVSEQNPPDFKWQQVEGAKSYDIVVASDPEFTDVKFSKNGLEANYYNFDQAFEEGVIYYWGVRYSDGEKTSEWSTPRRFRIQPGSTVFTVDDMDTILAKIPESHPRVLINSENIEEFLGYKDKHANSKAIYDSLMEQARAYVAENVIEAEPEWDENMTGKEGTAEYAEYLQNLRGMASKLYSKTIACSFAYVLSGDKEIGEFAADCLVELSKWDINGATSYEKQDQIHRTIMWRAAVCYDWLYDVLTDSEKEIVLTMVLGRALVMKDLLTNIPKIPYGSHGWNALSFMGIAGYATYGDLPEAEEWLKIIIPCFSAVMSPWSTQDGGYAQGTNYWFSGTQYNKQLIDVLAMSGLVNIYNKAYSQNEYLWMLYAYPPGSYGSFGDQANRSKAAMRPHGYTSLEIAYFTGNPVAKWLSEQFAEEIKFDSSLEGAEKPYFTWSVEDTVEAQAPLTYPLAHEFSDIGWIVMTNDIIDEDRIQATFKSSPYGSFNHSHADQNSFLIQAFGENLAIKSGYYDGYHTEHDSGFTRTTPAHNSVTVSKSKGQTDDSINAKGYLTGFLNQIDFDLASGDASEAYADNVLEKFERSMIYIRPDIFVVIDDLKAPGETEESFEWWLNAEHDISLYDNANGARLQEGEAVLDATVQYPQTISSYYINKKFAASDGVEYPAAGDYTTANVHSRVWFETEKVNNTKMVVTMDVHKTDQEARYTDVQYFDDYMMLIFEDGTVVLVNLTEDDREVVTEEGYTFTGQAVAYNERSIMLVHGTELKYGDKELIVLEEEGSVVMGANEIGISTYDDNRISVNTDNRFVNGIERVTDYNGNEMSAAYGLTYEKGKKLKKSDSAFSVEDKENYVTFTAEKDNYTLMLNGKLFEAKEAEATVKLIINGEEQEHKLTGRELRDGTYSLSATIPVATAKYTFKSKSDNVSISGFSVGESKYYSSFTINSTALEGNVIELEKIPTITTNAEFVEVGPGTNSHDINSTNGIYYKVILPKEEVLEAKLKFTVNKSYLADRSVRLYDITDKTWSDTYSELKATIPGTSYTGKTGRIGTFSPSVTSTVDGSIDITEYVNTYIGQGKTEMHLLLLGQTGSSKYINISTKSNGTSITYTLESRYLTEYGTGGDGSTNTTHDVKNTTGLFYRYDLSGIDAETERVSAATLKFYVSSITNAAHAIRVCKTDREDNSTTITGTESGKDYRIGTVTTDGTPGYYTINIKDYMNECIAAGKTTMTILLACQSDKNPFTVASMGSLTPPSIEYTITTEGALTVDALDIEPNGQVENVPTAKAIATATVKNNTFDKAEGIIIIAAYEGDALVRVNKVDWSVPQVTKKDVTAYIDPVSGATYNAFVWDNNLSPLTDAQ